MLGTIFFCSALASTLGFLLGHWVAGGRINYLMALVKDLLAENDDLRNNLVDRSSRVAELEADDADWWKRNGDEES
jgi:hypothetical protein